MTKTVLSVGQCQPDTAAIKHFLTSNFDVSVLTADRADDSAKALSDHSVDLVLINRKLDIDYSEGMEILRLIKADAATSDIPIMLISNFPESQESAVQEGAIYGFGKAELNSPETVDRVRSALNLP